MIAFIKGELVETTDYTVVIENNGIGYEIFVSPLTLGKVLKKQDTVKLFTFMHVKEDGISLYGFLTKEEINLFYKLITVSGIGPKVGVAILSFMTPSEIIMAILSEDLAALSKAPGVGKKTAQRLVLELKDKIKNVQLTSQAVTPQQTLPLTSSLKKEAVEALVSLGYSKTEALKSVMEVTVDGMTIEQIIKGALRKLSI